MSLDKIKKVGIFNPNTVDSLEIVARAKHVNPIIDLVNGIATTVGAGTFNTIAEYTSGTGITLSNNTTIGTTSSNTVTFTAKMAS